MNTNKRQQIIKYNKIICSFDNNIHTSSWNVGIEF